MTTTTLAIIIVAVLVLVAILAAAGAFDRTRRVSRRTRVVERPREVVVERPATERVVEQRRVDEP